jgi:AhpD family alkylhydroperoxidase
MQTVTTATTLQPRMKNPAAILPGAWQTIEALHAATGKGGVPAATLALVHLRVSQINGCSSCVNSGSQAAKQAGESDERLFTMERARQFERLLVSLDVGDLQAVMPQLRELTVPTLMVWGTGDAFFDVSWAYWLRDTIPGTTRVVTVDGARLFFPEERPTDLVPHLEQHWAAVAAARA